ncbi:MAG TPA: site-specific integrase [Syntrophobacter fumaroxidans]|nr:site-specific integrase [Syntrophobacter fumaroxidans]
MKLKKAQKVRYWIQYRLPEGKQKKEYVGFSIEEARDADGKRRVQKRENRIFEILPGSKTTFTELANWYLLLPSVSALASYDRVAQALTNFNLTFGKRLVVDLKPTQLEEYQGLREMQGMAPATIDMEIRIAKTMVTKGFDNDEIDGRALKAFRSIKKKLKNAANARKRTVTISEYLKLVETAALKHLRLKHLRPILITAYNTGMRLGELRQLKWSYIDRDRRFIRLPSEITKEGKPKVIPINHHVRNVLDGILPPNVTPITQNAGRTINDDHVSLQHDFVLTYYGSPIKSRDGLGNSFKALCKAAGIACGREHPEGITFHDIRRTVKTCMLSAGVMKEHRDLILGHSLQGMDVHYIVPSDDDLQRAMTIYTAWLDSQIQAHTEERISLVG